MRILILGAGAVGLTVAAKLSKHSEVYVVCRKRYADAIASAGFVMTLAYGPMGHTVFPAVNRHRMRYVDYIIISTKSVATRGICCEEYPSSVR